MAERHGKYTVRLQNSPSVVGFASVASKKESDGPMARYFDILNQDSLFGQNSWEKAESVMQQQSLQKALTKSSLTTNDIQYLFAGDLLNQCSASHYGMRESNIPFFGIYGACSTMVESLTLASVFVACGISRYSAAVTSSHFCSAERQYRFPLEYGGQRTPTSQWTVTASGAAIVGTHHNPPYVKAFTTGIIEDLGVADLNNMGAAMAPAAATTIKNFLNDTKTIPDNYDLILTGDLAYVGSELLYDLLQRDGFDIQKKHTDCGLLIYDRKNQDVGSGGSGCGCCAAVLCSHIMQSIQKGLLNNVLVCATGALMSPVSIQQGESIPGIAHLIHLSSME